MADETPRVSRKQEERRKGWIGIAIWILAGLVLMGIIKIATSIGVIDGDAYYIYFDDSVAGLPINSKVKFGGVEVGRVVAIELTHYPVVLTQAGTFERQSTASFSPKVEVKIVVTKGGVHFNRNSRAYLDSNPLSGLKQIDINDAPGGRGTELASINGGFGADLFVGGVDLAGWIDVTIDAQRAGAVTAIEFSDSSQGAMAAVQVTIPFRHRELDPSAYRASADASVESGRAMINLSPASANPEGYPVRAGAGEGRILIDLPARAIGIDAVLRGAYSATPAGAPARTLVTRLEQKEAIGSTGALVKFLRLEIEGTLEPTTSDARRYTRWLTLRRSLTEGVRHFDLDIIFEGDALPPGAALDIARSPLAVLLDRAEIIAEAIDYLPSIARNIEEASSNLVQMTTDLREGTLADLDETIKRSGAALETAIHELRASLLTRVETLANQLGEQVKRLGDNANGKLDAALPPETIANLQKVLADAAASTEDLRAGLAAARATFEQTKDVVGVRSADGKTVAETVESLGGALADVEEVLRDNATKFSGVLDQLRDTVSTLEKLIQELRDRK